jgi:hypothetical protein
MAASAPNTPTAYYLDTEAARAKCAKDLRDMERKCAPDDKNRHRGKGRPKSRNGHKDADKEASWVLDHCGPLMVQPGLENFKDWYEDFKDIRSMLGQVAQQLQDSVVTKLEQEIAEYATKQAIKFAARRGLTGWIPIVGWIITAVDVAVTAYESAEKISAMRDVVSELKGTVERLKEAGNKIKGTLDKHADKLKNFGNLDRKQQGEIAREVMADVQSAYGLANPCLRARKCMLVPYNKGIESKWQGKGCCPGQTGHHLLPDSMFRDKAASENAKKAWRADPANRRADGTMKKMSRGKLPKRKCWGNYSDGEAPTVCVEGNNQHLGSHGVLHELTQTKLGAKGYLGKSDMPYSEARDLLTTELSVMNGCEKGCLKAQLDAYYCGKAASLEPGCPDCEHSKVTPNSGMGNDSDKGDEGADET